MCTIEKPKKSKRSERDFFLVLHMTRCDLHHYFNICYFYNDKKTDFLGNIYVYYPKTKQKASAPPKLFLVFHIPQYELGHIFFK